MFRTPSTTTRMAFVLFVTTCIIAAGGLASAQTDRPQNLQATGTSTGVQLSWDAPSSASGLTGYVIYRRVVEPGTSLAQLAEVGASVTTYHDTAVSSGSRYAYRVRAKYGVALSRPTTPATIDVQNVEVADPPAVTTPALTLQGLHDLITALTVRVAALETASQAASNKGTENAARLDDLDCITTVGVTGRTVNDVVFSGCNVYVQNGAGATNTANGVGNLIVGYNESSATYTDTAGVVVDGTTSAAHSGSHNLVVGPGHTASSYGGIVAGLGNTASGKFATATGGYDNTASGTGAVVVGGEGNEVSGTFAAIISGADNTASGLYSAVVGGYRNSAVVLGAVVVGGEGNTAGGGQIVSSGLMSTVVGGQNKTTSSNYAVK